MERELSSAGKASEELARRALPVMAEAAVKAGTDLAGLDPAARWLSGLPRRSKGNEIATVFASTRSKRSTSASRCYIRLARVAFVAAGHVLPHGFSHVGRQWKQVFFLRLEFLAST